MPVIKDYTKLPVHVIENIRRFILTLDLDEDDRIAMKRATAYELLDFLQESYLDRPGDFDEMCLLMSFGIKDENEKLGFLR